MLRSKFLRTHLDAVQLKTHDPQHARAAQHRIDILDLHYAFDAGQRLWAQKEAAALCEVQTQQVTAQTKLVRAQNELLKAQLEQEVLNRSPSSRRRKSPRRAGAHSANRSRTISSAATQGP